MRKALVLLSAALLLGGCASLPPPLADQTAAAAKWRQHYAQVAAIESFSLLGRAASGGSVGVKADLRWRQFDDGHFDVRLSGPFGAGAISISGTEREVEIRTKDGIEYTADPEGWLLQRAGWTFPVRGLRWWARGLPSPETPAQPLFDADGRLAELQQGGWTFRYTEYQDVDGIALPRRFEASSSAITLKLIVDRWDTHPPVAGS